MGCGFIYRRYRIVFYKHRDADIHVQNVRLLSKRRLICQMNVNGTGAEDQGLPEALSGLSAGYSLSVLLISSGGKSS